MSRLLQTRLPIETEDVVSSGTYNRLVRVLEINLGEFDPDNLRQMNTTDRDKVKFNDGSLIWNTDIGTLQVYKGLYWESLSTPTDEQGYEAVATLGEVTVTTNGNVSITVGTTYRGYGVEKTYT
jgi:hypothetical protein|tara:strand:- start:435 stop:806 length:372 start_codon:yes stop_codon:yes gene_type:complete